MRRKNHKIRRSAEDLLADLQRRAEALPRRPIKQTAEQPQEEPSAPEESAPATQEQ
jgi:hypothetical protein